LYGRRNTRWSSGFQIQSKTYSAYRAGANACADFNGWFNWMALQYQL
jgi:hypothetical protein